MTTAPRPWWQFSLWELLIFTMVIAAAAAMVKAVGWGVLCVILHPLMIVVYIAIYIDRRLKQRLNKKREQRELLDSAARSPEP